MCNLLRKQIGLVLMHINLLLGCFEWLMLEDQVLISHLDYKSVFESSIGTDSMLPAPVPLYNVQNGSSGADGAVSPTSHASMHW